MSWIADELDVREYRVDDDLIELVRYDRKPRIRITHPVSPSVILGRGSDPDTELIVDNCLLDTIPVNRRPGGGCAVVIDPGNVIVSVVLPIGGYTDSRYFFNRLSRYIIGKLDEIGMSGVYQDGTSDLVLDKRKIGGSSMKRDKDYLYYSSTLLVDPRIELMERYLKHPPREPEYRKGRKHRDFIGRLPSMDGAAPAENMVKSLKEVVSIDELSQLY